MKSNATLKSLLVSGLLLMAGATVASAQDYAQSAGVTQKAASYRITIPENFRGMTERDGIVIGATLNTIDIREMGRDGATLLYDVSIPEGTPTGTVVTVYGTGTPLWHVTVADILGNSQSDDEVMLRPLDPTNNNGNPGTGVGSNPNAVAQPAGASTGTATSSVTTLSKATPDFQLYPNPTVSFVTIVTEGEVLWGVAEVVDPTGKRVLTVPTGYDAAALGTDKLTIHVGDLKTGIYFLRVHVGNDIVTKRFLVNK